MTAHLLEEERRVINEQDRIKTAKENQRQQKFLTRVYETNPLTSKRAHLSEQHWGELQTPFGRLFIETVRAIFGKCGKAYAMVNGIDLSDGENVGISRKRFGLFKERMGKSRHFLTRECMGHGMISTCTATAQAIVKIVMEQMDMLDDRPRWNPMTETPNDDKRGSLVCMMEGSDWRAQGDNPEEQQNNCTSFFISDYVRCPPCWAGW
jgi:hypothetical protein